ncbi:MAG: hypothetical protein ABI629_10540 [bacterium]
MLIRTALLGPPQVSLCLICDGAEWRFGSWSHFTSGPLAPPDEAETVRFVSFDIAVDFFRDIYQRDPPRT